MSFMSTHVLLWKIQNLGVPDAGWWCVTSCHARSCALCKTAVLGHELVTAFSYARPIFPKSPQLKYHLFSFIWFWHLFVLCLVSDFLSICPTHELCVYIKSWWCCERQRVRITSQTVSKDVFLGRPQPGPAPFPLLWLCGTAREWGAVSGWGWCAHAEPWSRCMGWKWCQFPSQVPFWAPGSSAMWCAAEGCSDLLLCWISPKAEHRVPMDGISHLFSRGMQSSFSHWAVHHLRPHF